MPTKYQQARGESEAFLGNEGLSSELQIMTKAPSCLVPGGSTKDGIIKHWKESEVALKTKRVAIYLLHVPDEDTSISETMEGIQALYLAGSFTQVRLPLSICYISTHITSLVCPISLLPRSKNATIMPKAKATSSQPPTKVSTRPSIVLPSPLSSLSCAASTSRSKRIPVLGPVSSSALLLISKLGQETMIHRLSLVRFYSISTALRVICATWSSMVSWLKKRG